MWHAKSVRVLVILAMVLGALAVGILSPPSVGSLPAGTASADPAVPNPGHPYSEIELPVGTWTGLDADKLDGLHASQLDVPSRPGFSVTTLDSVGHVGSGVSMTVGADGLGLMSYYDNTNVDLKVAHCSNVACSTATITTLDSAGEVGFSTSVTTGADGLGLISYYDHTNSALKVAHCSNAACTAATLSTLDSAGDVGDYTSVTVGADGLGLITYYDHTNHTRKVAHCSNTACSATDSISTLDSSGDVYWEGRSVTVGADGLGLITYVDYGNLDVKVAHCSNAACSAATITTLDSAGDVGDGNSVTVGTDGLGLISYYDRTNGDLKVVHCSNTACSTHDTPVTLDSSGDVGKHTSVTVGTDGLGLISYYDVTNGKLKVAHCSNTACTSATTTAIDSPGSATTYTTTAVTLGTDGLPLISYFDYTNQDLRVAHCSNRFCVPYHRPR